MVSFPAISICVIDGDLMHDLLSVVWSKLLSALYAHWTERFSMV